MKVENISKIVVLTPAKYILPTMLRELMLILVLTEVSQADVQWFYGEWTPVMMFPKVPALPACPRYLFFETPSKLQCTCADGRNATLAGMDLLQNTTEGRKNFSGPEMPMIEADNAADVRVSCTCGEKTYRHRIVVRSLNKDYAIMYEFQESLGHYTEKERNTAYIMARNIESAQVIESVVKHDQELKERSGTMFCSKEVLKFLT